MFIIAIQGRMKKVRMTNLSVSLVGMTKLGETSSFIVFSASNLIACFFGSNKKSFLLLKTIVLDQIR